MTTFIAFIFVLSLLVFVHEFGHYLVAKLSGIGVLRFSLGLPPRLVGIHVGETDYCLSAIPFGGYVKLIGQDDFAQEEDESDVGPRDYRGKSTPVKIAVLVAGASMNILTAVVIFFLLFWIQGVPENSTSVGYVTPESYAEEAGIKSGDEIIAANGTRINKIEQALISLYTEDSVSLIVRTGDFERTVNITRKLGENEGFGILPYYDARIKTTLSDSPAEKAGLMAGDVITAIDDIPVDGGWYHMSEIVKNNPGSEMIFTIKRNGSDIRIPLVVGQSEEEMPDGTTKTTGKIGIAIDISTRKVGGFEAFKMAFVETKFITVHTIDFLGKLITGRMSSKLIGGPVLIAQIAGESAKSGFASLMGFAAFISINLGVLNLLPFPVLDGGHIFILLFEAVIRRKIPMRFRLAVQQAGSIILILLMIYITFNDLMRFNTFSRIFGG